MADNPATPEWEASTQEITESNDDKRQPWDDVPTWPGSGQQTPETTNGAPGHKPAPGFYTNEMKSNVNLLLILDALLQTSSVTEAARRVGLSQSAASHALSRLRKIFEDPLLVRTGRRMERTARALALAPRVRDVVAGFERLFDAGAPVELGQLRRTFHIHISEAVLVEMGPALHAVISDQAPMVDIHICSLAHDRISEALREGALDLAIDTFAGRVPDLDAHPLFTDRLVGVVRSEHPAMDAGLSIERFADLRHVRITSTDWAGEKRALDRLDALLAAHGRARRIVCSVPHALMACRLVARTDSIVITSQCMAASVAANMGIRILELPITIPPYTINLVWPTRSTTDPAHGWLREQIMHAAPLKFLVAGTEQAN